MGYNRLLLFKEKLMTLSLGRLMFVAILLSILVMSGIFAMDVYASLQDVGQQYTTSSTV
jgi:hypothetical protein